mgnify:CR=1 FL=1
MAHQTRVVFSIFCLFVLFLGIGPFISPYTKLDERSKCQSKCRKEIALIRDFLRNSNLHMKLNFISWRLKVCTNTNISTMEQMSRYCWIVCERTGTSFLNFRIKDGVPLLIDPWGGEYNIAETNKLPVIMRYKSLSNWNVGPFVIWSSGPNQKNEYGAGDDIVGMRKQKCDNL